MVNLSKKALTHLATHCVKKTTNGTVFFFFLYIRFCDKALLLLISRHFKIVKGGDLRPQLFKSLQISFEGGGGRKFKELNGHFTRFLTFA